MSYSWSTEEYSDHYSTDFDTIEECIKEAKDMGCKAGTTIWNWKSRRSGYKTGRPNKHTRRFTQCCI